MAVVSVTGLWALTGCGLPDHRESVGVPGSSPSGIPSVVPQAPLPSGRPLGADARVPSPSGVDGTDATEVSEAWAEVAYGYDTKYDSGPHDAVLRSARWFTAKKDAAEWSYRPACGAGNDWNTWAGHKAWSTMDVTADDDGDGPVDTAVAAHRALFVDCTAPGHAGWTGTGPRANVCLKLTRAGRGQPWHVDEVTAVEAAVPPSPSPSSPSPSSSSLSSSSTPS
ncbi:hypothetical protein GCM10011579_078120 [Streptomyces albiflavescens]|uniref:Lipoprotein n=1 Tax=Streptomyces albiflavescens TaxID=1623582 RepID=A0A918D8J2_9ACTN|nr:hypothetical protein [Streptomyces albiflavescens]GGN86368.1 hypothetical protein GCM10011579_078120 [Streptomyces albiflavescens]